MFQRIFVNNGFRSLLYRFFFFFLVVSLVIQIIHLITYQMNLKYFREELEQNYSKSLAVISSRLNNIFSGVYNSNFLLSIDQATMQLFSSDYLLDSPAKYAVIPGTIRSLNRIRLMNDYVDSVYIYKKKDHLIVSNNGTYHADTFFTEVLPLQEYPLSFWRDYDSQQSPFQILPPSNLISNGEESILPIIQTAIAEYRSNDLYVINLKMGAIAKLLADARLTPNSELLVLNENQQVLASTLFDKPTTIDLKSVLLHFQDTPTQPYKTEINGKRMEVIHLNSYLFFSNVDIIAFVSESDIRGNMEKVSNLWLTTGLLALVLSTLLSIAFSKNLYIPIHRIITKLEPDYKPRNVNEYKLLTSKITRMLENMDKLHEDINSMSPLVIEQWFMQMLRTNRVPDQKNLQRFLSRSQLSLPHDHFGLILIRVKFEKTFYINFSPSEQHLIHDRITSIIKSAVNSDTPSFFLQFESHLFGLVINLPTDAVWAENENRFNRLIELFKHNENVRDIFIGMGEVQRGFEGLLTSYMQAVKAMWRLSLFDNKRIYHYREIDEIRSEASLLLSTTDEQKMLNLLLTCKTGELMEMLQQTIDYHVSAGCDDLTFKELYMHLFVLGNQALKQKGKMLPEASYREYIRMILSEHLTTVVEMKEFIEGYYQKIIETIGTTKPSSDALLFKKFINEHYQEDIHLEYLADKFNTSPTYMSRLLKKELGMQFKKYLQEIRIREAKELLISSDMMIQDICSAVGFNNRNSFIRTFKLVEGISPTEYREQFKRGFTSNIHYSE